MICAIRIDDRLLHGQVAYSWKAALKYEALVIASDDAAEDKLRIQALKIAKPDGVKLAIRSTKESVTLLNNEQLDDLQVFVVTDSVQNAKKLYEGIHEKPVLILGGLQKRNEKQLFAAAVYLSKEDVFDLDTLAKAGIEIQVKQVPNDKNKSYKDYRSKFEQ